MKDKRNSPKSIVIDPELKATAEAQLLEEIALIEHWITTTQRQSQKDQKVAALNAKYIDMLRSRQDMLAALQKQLR